MEEIEVTLNIPAELLRHHYSGLADTVIAQASDGRRIRFPAARLRRFVTRDGVYGVFVLRIDARHKLIDIRRKST